MKQVAAISDMQPDYLDAYKLTYDSAVAMIEVRPEFAENHKIQYALKYGSKVDLQTGLTIKPIAPANDKNTTAAAAAAAVAAAALAASKNHDLSGYGHKKYSPPFAPHFNLNDVYFPEGKSGYGYGKWDQYELHSPTLSGYFNSGGDQGPSLKMSDPEMARVLGKIKALLKDKENTPKTSPKLFYTNTGEPIAIPSLKISADGKPHGCEGSLPPPTPKTTSTFQWLKKVLGV